MNHPGAPAADMKPEWKSTYPMLHYALETINPDESHTYETVDAQRVKFADGFVQFWNERGPDEVDELVLAVAYVDVASVYETPTAEPRNTHPEILAKATEWAPIREANQQIREIVRPAKVAAELLNLDTGDI